MWVTWLKKSKENYDIIIFIYPITGVVHSYMCVQLGAHINVSLCWKDKNNLNSFTFNNRKQYDFENLQYEKLYLDVFVNHGLIVC